MALFNKKAVPSLATLQATVAKLRSRRDDLVAELDRVNDKIATKAHTCDQLLIDAAPPEAVAKAQAALADAELRKRTLVSAIAKLDDEITKAETDTVELARKMAAEEASTAATADDAEVHAAILAVADAARKLLPLAEKHGRSIYAAREAEVLAKGIGNEFPTLAQRIQSETQGYVAQLLSGSIRPQSPTPAAAIAAPKPAIQKQRIFSLDLLKWVEDGEVKRVAKYQDIDVPVASARRAVEKGHALKPDNHRVKGLRCGYAAPPSTGGVDIDDENLKQARPVMGLDVHLVEAQMRETVGGTQNWINAQRG